MQPNVSEYIDHTLLKPEATSDQIRQICAEAKTHGFFGVCVNSYWIPLVSEVLKDSDVSPVAVVGFPLGAMATQIKADEALWCRDHGALEIDMVLNIGRLKEGNFASVEEDIRAVVKSVSTLPVKVILETSFLTDEEKTKACKLAVRAGAHFVKTSTGFGGGGATIEDIILMRKAVGPKIGVKASGGIKNLEQAIALIEAGANRLGTSSGVSLVQGKSIQGGY